SNIQAAIGCAQLERIEELVNLKREILASYMIRLSALPGITMNPEYTGTINVAWMPTAVFHRSVPMAAPGARPPLAVA
ncbi:DegT/DnrJ/EryC1/StrS family aminotransferase, partial [Rhizobium ruizarguesonis]